MKNYHKKCIIICCICCTILIIAAVITGFIAYNTGYDIGYDAGYKKGFKDNQPIAKDKTPIVYITPSGSKYHSKNCDYVDRGNLIEISVKQAKAKDYTACSYCSTLYITK